jgi:hypothetical protein
LTNTIKAELALWGIQGFKPGLRKAAEHLEALRTVEGAYFGGIRPLISRESAPLFRSKPPSRFGDFAHTWE